MTRLVARLVSSALVAWAVLALSWDDARAANLGPLLANDLVISTGLTGTAAAPVAFDGSRYLIVWEEGGISGRFVDTAGSLSGPPFVISSSVFSIPAVAFNGTVFFVVAESSGSGIVGRVVGTDGRLLGSEITISDRSTGNAGLAVASDGASFLVVWADQRNFATSYRDILGQRISVDGAGNPTRLGGSFPVSPAAGEQFRPALAFGRTTYLVTWTQDSSPNAGERDVFGALVTPAGSVSPPIAISTASSFQTTAGSGSVAFGHGAFLVVFDDMRTGASEVSGMRVTEDGALLDGTPETGGIRIPTGATFDCQPHAPTVTFGGGEWLVVWGCLRTRGTMVSPEGVVRDPGGRDLFVSPSSQVFPAVASDGTNHLVTWELNGSGFTKFAQLVGPVTNRPPVGDAGPDQTVAENAPVTLNGSVSSDPDGDTLSFQWVQIAGPPVALDLADPARPRFLAPGVPAGGETLTFQLTVSDGQLTGAADTVNITVKNVNRLPVVDAGVDQTVSEGSPVTLDGARSFDPDGETLVFAWRQIAGPDVPLSATTESRVSFVAPPVGPAGATLTFELTVSDGLDSAHDSVSVFVDNVNHAPTADAGPDQTVAEWRLVTLDGTRSMDPDGDPLIYAWSQLAGPPVALSATATASPKFTAPSVGPGGATLVFRLDVSDGLGAAAADEVTITVLNVNDPPRCDLAASNPSSLWPPDHKLVPVQIVGVSDPDNDQVRITVTRVTQDEPVAGLGAGDTSPDAVIGAQSVLLRAERSGTGNGRAYVVWFRADDGQATCEGSVPVTVPHSTRPGGGPVDDGQFFDSTVP
jgi:hypothetical protein